MCDLCGKNSPDEMEKSLNPENGDVANVGERRGYAEFTVTEKAKTNKHRRAKDNVEWSSMGNLQGMKI